MRGIGEFLSERLVKALPAPNAEGVGEARVAALVVLGDCVPPAAAQQLASSLEEYASGQEFAKAVDDAVPAPRQAETEDEFVLRAKEAIRRVLMQKFGR